MDYKNYFKGKKITVMGLGILGRGLNDTIFLAERGAELIVTDLRTKETLAPSLLKLSKYKNIKYVLGEHRLEDFRNRDFILQSAGVAMDSPFIAEARKACIPIEMDASLFAKLAPKGVTLIGITGTRGKTTTTLLTYAILKEAFGEKKVFLGGNIKGIATLPLIEKVKEGYYIVMELDSWQLQGFGEAKLSPHIAVFTNFMADHLNYYKGDMNAYFADKAKIFENQTTHEHLICKKEVAERIASVRPKSHLVVVTKDNVPKEWKVQILGDHNLENIACALQVADILGISREVSRKAIEAFRSIPGRLEFLREMKGVKIYNDNNATTPSATIAGLQALGSRAPKSDLGARLPRKIILILGGSDKGLDMNELVLEIGKTCKAIVLLKENGSERIKPDLWNLPGVAHFEEDGLEKCIARAMTLAQSGDTVLFSPAFASFGKWFKNEYDRGEQFVTLVNSL